MTGTWLIGGIVFFAILMINRSIMTSALRKLDDETKLKFIDVFTKRNNYSSIMLVVLILLFVGGMQFFPQHKWILSVVYLVALISIMVARFLINYKKLNEINVTPEYFRSFFISTGFFILGLGALFVFGYWGSFSF
jgi:uncharacterized membrane protein YjjP (DUF1212 family)